MKVCCYIFANWFISFGTGCFQEFLIISMKWYNLNGRECVCVTERYIVHLFSSGDVSREKIKRMLFPRFLFVDERSC